ncbi:hypothetical protein B0H10DRAFT_2220457 [Mycena sp. CBHHK59/15]|nr:hypothetical protein B0H10DRAFT_2220457 [Mycena sp. CBHHK59/15]
MDDHHSQRPPQIGLKLFRMLTGIDTHLVACRVRVAAIQASCCRRGACGTPRAIFVHRLSEEPHHTVLLREAGDYMVYMCGVCKDYGCVVQHIRDAAWSWDQRVPYMCKNEHYEPILWGLTSVMLVGFLCATDVCVLQTMQELPDEFSFNLDIDSVHVAARQQYTLHWMSSHARTCMS